MQLAGPDQGRMFQTQVQAQRGEESVRRDAKKWKKINCKPAPTFEWTKEMKEDYMGADIGPPMNWRPQQAPSLPEPALLQPQVEQPAGRP